MTGANTACAQAIIIQLCNSLKVNIYSINQLNK